MSIIRDKRYLFGFCVILIFMVGCESFFQRLRPEPPSGMVYVPSGAFTMGSQETLGKVGLSVGRDELPAHQVFMKGFFIDRYEVTNDQYLAYLVATKQSYRPSSWKEGVFKPEEKDHAVVDVDWHDATAYCRWAGKRLPTEAEWEKAARGPEDRIWPWGDTFKAGKANTLEAGIGWTSPVGSFSGDVSFYGVYDMAGNVREWVDGNYALYPGAPGPPWMDPHPYRVLRGGSYMTDGYRYARTASRFPITATLATRGHNWHSNYDHGFRCAQDP